MAVCCSVIAITSKADEGQKVNSKVEKVTVFLNGAQVTRVATVNIAPGNATLVFGNISPEIDPQSIQVHANSEFTILSVKHQMDYLSDVGKEKKVEDLQVQCKRITDEIASRNNELAIYQEEEELLRKSLAPNPQNTNQDIVKLKQALDFQTQRLTEIKKKEQTLGNEVTALSEQLQKYTQQLNETNSNPGTANSVILVNVSSKTALQSEFSLSYLVHRASWSPAYDIRAKNVNSPIKISYKANVVQQSGEDWKNIRLTLSTGNPSVNAIKPELNPYYLNIAPPAAQYKSNQLNEVVVVGYGTKASDDYDTNADVALRDKVAGVKTIPVSVNQVENQTSVEFKIDDPYSIPADGKQCMVEIQSYDINAAYQYVTVPKLSTDVFLTAKLTDWNKYNFLPGQTNLYFEGTFLGKSYINTNSAADTLNLSLGVDKGIVVTRKSAKELTGKQGIGANKKETRDWLIEVKNHKNQPVNLLVEDQVPVSQNSSIEVETENLSGGELDKDSGEVKWNMNLKPMNGKKIELKYIVKYPKNQLLVIR
jgi:uncharacterized protein (TIGR02231 family)